MTSVEQTLNVGREEKCKANKPAVYLRGKKRHLQSVAEPNVVASLLRSTEKLQSKQTRCLSLEKKAPPPDSSRPSEVEASRSFLLLSRYFSAALLLWLSFYVCLDILYTTCGCLTPFSTTTSLSHIRELPV